MVGAEVFDDLADGSERFVADMAEQDDVGVGSALEQGEGTRRPRWQKVLELFGDVGVRSVALAKGCDGSGLSLLGKERALGKDHSDGFLIDSRGERADWFQFAFEVLWRAVDEDHAHAMADHVDVDVPLEVVFENVEAVVAQISEYGCG